MLRRHLFAFGTRTVVPCEGCLCEHPQVVLLDEVQVVVIEGIARGFGQALHSEAVVIILRLFVRCAKLTRRTDVNMFKDL